MTRTEGSSPRGEAARRKAAAPRDEEREPDVGPVPDQERAVEERFRAAIDAEVRQPLLHALERYRDALRTIMDRMASLAREEASGTGSAGTEAPAADPGAGGALARYEYADRFAAAFRPDILDPADRERAAFLERLDEVAHVETGVPATISVGPAAPDAAVPDPMVRPRLRQRLMDSLRKQEERVVPSGQLARLYLADLSARLDSVANVAASLDSITLAAIRRQLHVNADPVPPPAAVTDPGVDAELRAAAGESALHTAIAAVERELDRAIRAAEDGFERAIRAPAVHVGDEAPEAKRERTDQRRGRLLEEWESFENALHANTTSEAVLARSLAALEASAARAARELDQALDLHARQPLDHMVEALTALAGEAGARLHESPSGAVETLRAEAAAIFNEALPSLAERLPAALAAATESFVEALRRIPEEVPDDLRISEERVHGVPERPTRLALRDAPLDDLLSTACQGALPRWVERAMEGTTAELQALTHELRRVSNAVDFHIRAPLRGDFDDDEAAELVVASMQRAASQIEELRDTGLDSVERVMTELERRSADEAEALRSAVADREFLRIRSEIAEEHAVRGLSAAMEWARRLVMTGLRFSRHGWSAGRRTYDITQEWAERRLGVGDVEREHMLETMEESLLDDERRIHLPGLYRQLFDVEDVVPWEELLVPRSDELATLRRALDRWHRGHAAAAAVVGEKGSGKTTLLRMAAPDLFGDIPTITLDLDSTVRDARDLAGRLARAFDVDTDNWGDLTAALREQDPAVVVVENAHHLFIRALGGFVALESFLELLTATRRQLFWIVTIDEYAWQYLDRVMGVAPYFSHVLNTTNLPAERLERAVMARHEVSGFSLRFELDEDRLAPRSWWGRLRSREARGELTRRELERQAYFRELNQIAEGNIFLALFYWVRSVDRVEDHVLVLRRPEIIDLGFLERLPLPSLHTIAGIILHGSLSQAEHRRIFELSAPESRLQLAALADAHLIFRTGEDEYTANRVLYRPLIRLLKTRNIF